MSVGSKILNGASSVGHGALKATGAAALGVLGSGVWAGKKSYYTVEAACDHLGGDIYGMFYKFLTGQQPDVHDRSRNIWYDKSKKAAAQGFDIGM